MPAGRPTRYNKDYGRMAKKACQLGATNDDLAELFNVSVRTILRWEKKHPDEFRRPLMEGKSDVDDEVEKSLYQRAVGGWKTTEKRVTVDQAGNTTKQAIEREEKPDTIACIFWLKNRRPDKWRDRPEMEGSSTDLAEAFLKLSQVLPT